MNLKHRLPLLAVILTSVFCIAISIFSLESGQFTIFQNIFYIPIIVACFNYGKRGFAVSVALSCIYFFLIIAFTSDPMIIRDALIRVILFILIAAVITALSIARAQAEASLLKEREKFRTVADYTYDWEYWTDPQQKMLYVSPSCERISGYHPEDFIVDSGLIYNLVHPDDRDIFKCHADHYHKLQIDSVGEIVFRIVNRNGGTLWIAHLCQPVYSTDGQFLGRRASNRNITERKQTEEALRESETKYQLLFDRSLDGIAVFGSIPPKFLFVNPAFLSLFGYTAEEILAFSADDMFLLVHPEDREVVRNRLLSRFRQEATPNNYEFRIVTKDGQVRWVEVSASLFYNREQLFSQAIYRDVTERKRTEDALRDREEKYREIFEGMTDVFYRTDNEGLLLIVSPSVEHLWGYVPNEIIGEKLTEFYVNAEERDQLLSLLREKGEVKGFEAALRTKDGSAVIVSTNAQFYRNKDGDIIGVQGISRDITDRKKAEEALQDSETRFRQLADSTWEGILIHRDGIVLDGNKSLLDIFGYDTAEAVGKSVLDFIAPEFTEKVTQMMKQGTPSSVLHFEGIGRRKNGTVFPMEALGRSITYKNRPARVITIRDLTEQKQAEADREKLEEQNRQIQKAESLGRMAGAIAHHFNNNLGAVIGNLEMVIDDLPKGDNHANILTAAMKSAWNAAEMSGLMLTYLGQTSGKREAMDLSETCLQSRPSLRAIMPGKVLLETDLPTPGPVISANTKQIQQILTNLITNAWEAVDEDRGAIHLRVKTVSSEEIPTLHRHPIDWQPQSTAYSCLEVSDTGDGIADKDIEKLFDPFFSSKFTGRGLGLPVVLGIVRAHGGSITVESELGRGSIFRVFFPISTEEFLRQPDKANKPLTMERGGTVLLVEDEEMVRNMAAAMLKRLGFTVVEAKDGVEAVEVFRQRQNEIRFVLSDLTMPRMNGWETLTALRKLAPDVPVILASGYDEAHVMAGDHPELPQAFLGKPYKLKGLSDAISQALADKK